MPMLVRKLSVARGGNFKLTAALYASSLLASCSGLLWSGYTSCFPWKTITIRTSEPGDDEGQLVLQVRRQAPPIGCALWPAGRVMMFWARRQLGNASNDVLEIGSGCGCTAIGLAQVMRSEEEKDLESPRRKVYAIDMCEYSLANLRRNVKNNKMEESIEIVRWDLQGKPPFSLQRVEHLIAADVIYKGGCDRLAACLHDMLQENPKIKIHLLLVDRFSGSVVNAVAGVAGVEVRPSEQGEDPELEDFERSLELQGLEGRRHGLGEELRQEVMRSLPLEERMAWWLCGTWEGLKMLEIRAKKNKERG